MQLPILLHKVPKPDKFLFEIRHQIHFALAWRYPLPNITWYLNAPLDSELGLGCFQCLPQPCYPSSMRGGRHVHFKIAYGAYKHHQLVKVWVETAGWDIEEMDAASSAAKAPAWVTCLSRWKMLYVTSGWTRRVGGLQTELMEAIHNNNFLMTYTVLPHQWLPIR